MVKTKATVEYNELVRTKHMFDQQVQYISTLENQVSVLSHDLDEYTVREQSIIARLQAEHNLEIDHLKRQYTQTYESMYLEAERTVLAEHEKLVKLQSVHDDMKLKFDRSHERMIQSIEQQFNERWTEEKNRHQTELTTLRTELNAALVERDLYAKRLQEHVDAKSTDDWFREGRSVSPIRTHTNTEVFSMNKEPEKETVRTDTSYDSCTSRLSRAITKYDSHHATSTQQQLQIQTPEAAARAYAETPSFSRSFSK
jgi:hypothetical protein